MEDRGGAGRHEGSGESLVTVVVAGAAKLLIALAKGIEAMISGSAAMLSEAAHSVADTVTEVLLFVAVRRGGRPGDARHPLGSGRESYLWGLLAASVLIGGILVIVAWSLGSANSSLLVGRAAVPALATLEHDHGAGDPACHAVCG